LIGKLLGDGHIKFKHKKKNTKAGQPLGNALFAMTLKDFDYINHLIKILFLNL
jgi:hypothetical protein